MASAGQHNQFKNWILQEMDKREWSQADLARYANLNRAVINKLLNGQATMPRPSTLDAIARAFKIPVEKIYRIAGLLPSIPENEDFTEEALHLLNQIQDPKHRSTILLLIKAFIAEEEEQNRK